MRRVGQEERAARKAVELAARLKRASGRDAAAQATRMAKEQRPALKLRRKRVQQAKMKPEQFKNY